MDTTKLEVIEGGGAGLAGVGVVGEVGASGWCADGDSAPTGSIALVPVDDAGVLAGVAGRRNQRGMVSAEWAVGIIAAIGIAGVLIAVVTNGAVQEALLRFVLQVIHSFSGFMVNR